MPAIGITPGVKEDLMDQSYLHKVINASPYGFAHHEIILDGQDKPVDYRFIDVNPAFEKLTNLKAPQIIGKTVREAIPGIEKGEFDWIGFYGRIALEGGNETFEQYSEPLGRWYHVNVYSHQKGFFTTTFFDVTEKKKSSETLESFFALNLDLLCIADINGNFVKTNEAWSRILGYSTEDLNRKKFLEFVHPDDLQSTLEAITKLGKGQEVLNFTNRYLCKDGSYRDIEWHSHPKGNLIFAAARDITERVISEEKMALSERTYREIFDNITDALFIHAIDTGAIVDVNDTMLNMYGYKREEMDGVTVADLSALVEPYTNEYAAKLIKRAAAGETVVFEWLNRKKNGELFYSENVLRFVTIAGQDRIMAIVHDITERKRAEKALRESEAKLSALFASMTEMVVLHELVFDENGSPVNYRIIDFNDAYTRITGIRREDAVGKLGNEAYGTPEPPYFTEFSQVALTGEAYHYETYFPPMDKYFSISVVSPGKNQFATITTDISDQKRIQAAISAKNQELEQLVYVASHDLRSPLVNVDGFSRELEYSLAELRQILDTEGNERSLGQTIRAEMPEMEASLKRIRTSTRHMDTLLKGLLKLSRSGRATLQITNIHMNDLIRQLASSFAFRLQQEGVQLSVDELPDCRGDVVQVTQVFANLLDNALKYLDPNRPGRIHIRGAIEKGRAVYRVEDNGIGIPENHINHVFELFHRLNPDQFSGEGLGLTIAKQALGRMEGEIHVESRATEGCTFVVTLKPAYARR